MTAGYTPPFTFSPAHEAFRAEVRGFLAAHPSLVGPRQFFHGRGGTTRELYRALGARGWLSLTWPAEHGGAGLSAAHEFVLWDELARARAARPDLGPGIVASTILHHGTDDQRARYLPGIRDGSTGFALGYSEPEAGSDLGGVRTRAVRAGDAYVVTGEKRWTSDAHNARYLWTLCRTGDQADRSRGVSLLVVDLAAPGVDVRPIPTIDGHRLNEVFLDEVVVPAADRVGPEGGAWALMRDALAVERHLQLLPGRVARDLDELVAWAQRSGVSAATVPGWDAVVAGLVVDLAEVTEAALATLAAVDAGRDAAVAAARTKLLGCSLAQRIARAALDVGAPTLLEPGDDLGFLWDQSVMETIAGGTSEVMRSVVARQALGLGARA